MGVSLKHEKVANLKWLSRTGWMLRGIPNSVAETVAAHSFEVAYLTMVLADRLVNSGCEIDVAKALRMALIHDIPESIMGDIVKWSKDRLGDGPDRLEEEAIEELGLQNYGSLLKELNEGTSVEALIVKLADNLSTALQGIRYRVMGHPQVSDIVEGSKQAVLRLMSKGQLANYSSVIEQFLKELGIL